MNKKIITWTDSIVEVLIKIGKPAHLSEIYREVRSLRDQNNLSWPQTAEASIRGSLERKSSDMISWDGSDDLFGNSDKGGGIWYLRGLEILQEKKLTITESKSLINARVGQGEYRKKLLKLWNNSCSVSKINNEKILIAGHIKPWRDSNNSERLDPYNGFLLLPNIDKLFDKGLITFNLTGEIIISKYINKEQYDLLGINQKTKIVLFDQNKKYLSFHMDNIFNN
tara:strand:+ start:134 stop:808 length:675 start_codon:yes stop_codon:yes gene_type:complete